MSMVLFIENSDVNVGEFKKYFILRGGRGERGIRYNTDLKGCKDVQRVSFDTVLQCFKYAFLVAAHKPMARGVTKTYLDNLVVNEGGEETKYPKVNFHCLNGQYPVTLKRVNIFERSN